MIENSIPRNLKRMRGVKGLTQEKLARLSGLSLPGYRKIERGQSDPRPGSLERIARSLGVRTADLVVPVPSLQAVRFRSNKRLKIREQVLADVAFRLSDYRALELLLRSEDRRKNGDFGRLRASVPRSPSRAAAFAHARFGLDDDEPIHDICGLLEAGGIKVISLSYQSDGFFGMSVAADDLGPAIVINTWNRIPVERWIFTAAHELGHLLLHTDDYDTDVAVEEKSREKEANEFAAHFLMPDKVFRKEWSEACGLPFVDRVLKVKRIFRVSYRTVLFRLSPQYRGPGNIWSRFQIEFKEKYGRTLLKADEPDALASQAFRGGFPGYGQTVEPAQLVSSDFVQDRLPGLVRKALEKELISIGRAAEVLRISLSEMRKLTASWVV